MCVCGAFPDVANINMNDCAWVILLCVSTVKRTVFCLMVVFENLKTGFRALNSEKVFCAILYGTPIIMLFGAQNI